jgi:hypothetical protein
MKFVIYIWGMKVTTHSHHYWGYECVETMPELRSLVSGIPLQWPGSGRVEVVVDKMALGQVFSEYIGFRCKFLLQRLLHINYSSYHWCYIVSILTSLNKKLKKKKRMRGALFPPYDVMTWCYRTESTSLIMSTPRVCAGCMWAGREDDYAHAHYSISNTVSQAYNQFKSPTFCVFVLVTDDFSFISDVDSDSGNDAENVKPFMSDFVLRVL